MRRLVYLAAAQCDLVSILYNITHESDSLTVGRGFVGQLRGHCTCLASLPGSIGRARPELRPDMRNSAFKVYDVFFRYQDDHLEVVNTLEGHRDIDGDFEPTRQE